MRRNQTLLLPELGVRSGGVGRQRVAQRSVLRCAAT